ncbi:VCBS domain-containing protein, partial [Bradyrhizobium sp.]|uniref:VCBS domain-containing protein n=1 Tax=Bradyrhizobium sp. TaxID=376 RepID=UPI003C727945
GGTLTVHDVDSGEAVFQAVAAAALTGTYGNFTFDSVTGTWTYALVHGQADSLKAGQVVHDTLTVVSADGTASQLIDVTITGTNDTPVITAQDLIGAVAEQVIPAGNLSDSGTIGFTDVDLADVHLVSATGTPIGTTLGTLTAVKNSDTTGTGTGGLLTWTYTVADSAVEYLAAGQTKVESFTITLNDQHGGLITKQIDVTITGTNDAAVVSGTSSGTVVEAGGVANGTPGTPTATGTLTDTDVDNTPNTFIAAAAGSATDQGYGTYQMTAAGVWTYTLNNSNAAVQALNVNQHLTDTFTVRTADGTAKVVTVTINGSNDAAVISGKSSGSVEVADDGPGSGKLTDTGTLTDTDVDNTPNTFIAAAAGTATDHGYGTYQMTAAGVWTYTLNSSNAAVRALEEGHHLTDTFTVRTVDGTAKVVTVTINDLDPPVTRPAGVAGSAINLGLAAAPPDPGSLVTVTIANLPSDWSLKGGVQVDAHTWTIQTSDVQSLSVTTSSASLGAVLLEVSESWTKPDGGIASVVLSDNVESYAVGSPIFVLPADDYLTASGGSDL